ncbi:S8 family peptidase [Saccharothrix variisporea]|uniref:Serine protease AprX n=1 Tax=Saccharothrix variisporea TaxID=543527 RepID=A0A495XEF9_9PSEU|nr:S8 family serine peptidase [Saccharothrix variisporea]RKT69928.1 serine protease AprX [Saccharothrix variisporea]
MRKAALAAAGVLALSVVAAPSADAGLLAPVSALLSSTYSGTVLVHGTDLAAAERAVTEAGLTRVTSFDRIGVVAARGSAAKIAAVRAVPGVTYVEAEQPIRFTGSTSHTATRGLEARQTLTGANGLALDGSGVTVAVIDSGVDPTHPAFKTASGQTKVVRNLKSLCVDESSTSTGCIVDVPTSVDTDTLSVGGHGTHVTGIAVGSDVKLTDGTVVRGAAPGAKAVVISTGAALLILGADAALNWVLENHAAPCGAGVPASTCPPIKVVNNSYGPVGGGAFDPNSATAKLQRALAAQGVVTVWANGNDGGDGTTSLSNPPGQDPAPGVISVASYNDQDTGTRDGTVSDYSSRGLATDQSTWPDISAPGENITSACRPYLVICATGLKPQNGPGLLDLGTYNTISGTSMAAPHIAGIVAQLFQARPSATPGQVEAALKASAYKYGGGYVPAGAYTSSFDRGTGLVDVVAAVTALRAL